MRPARDWIDIALLVLMWGSAFSFIKLAVAEISPAALAFYRVAMAAIVMGVFVAVRRIALPRKRSTWAHLLLLGLMGNALPFFAISWGQTRVDSGLAGILMAIMPLTTLVLAHFILPGERMTPRRTLGFVLGFLGIVVLMGPEALLEFAGRESALAGQLAVLLGALCYAINAILAKQIPEGLDPRASTTIVMSFASVALLPAVWATGGFGAPETSMAWLAVGWLGVISTAAATVVYFRVVSRAGPTFVSLINYLIPLVALGIGIAFLGEAPHARAWLALLLILGGIAISQTGQGRLDPA